MLRRKGNDETQWLFDTANGDRPGPEPAAETELDEFVRVSMRTTISGTR